MSYDALRSTERKSRRLPVGPDGLNLARSGLPLSDVTSLTTTLSHAMTSFAKVDGARAAGSTDGKETVCSPARVSSTSLY